MKAAYLKIGWNTTEICLAGDTHHHLVNVLRVRESEKVLLLDGKGKKAHTKIEFIDKKQIKLKIVSEEICSRSSTCDVLIFIPKKDALEGMLKALTELGVPRAILYRGEFSQEKLPSMDRINALLQSAMEQSNNPWLPEVLLCQSAEDLPLADYQQIFVMDLGTNEKLSSSCKKKSILVVGPEGGFSPSERQYFAKMTSAQIVSLPTPILRAPTAMTTGLGWWLGQCLKH